MSTELVRQDEGLGFQLTSLALGKDKGIGYQITTDTGYVILTDWQMLRLCSVWGLDHNTRTRLQHQKGTL